MPTITNNTTANYAIPLPASTNRIVDDIPRMISALTTIDTLLATKATVGDNNVELDVNGHLSMTVMPGFTGDVEAAPGTSILTLSVISTPGTYKSVTVDATGRVVSGTNPNTIDSYGIIDAVKTNTLGAHGGVATLNMYGVLTADQSPAYTGGEVVSSAGSLELSLLPSGVSVGTYNQVTVDAKGRVTAATNTAGQANGVATLNSGSLLSTAQMPAFTGDVTSIAGSLALSLADNGVAAGTYTTVTVDSKGRVTSGANTAYIQSGGTLTNCTIDGTNPVGYLNIPQNKKNEAYVLTLSDAGKHIFHESTDLTARTYTIPANSSVPYPIGTALGFINMSPNVVNIVINTDTMYLAGSGLTGPRVLALYGTATAIKMTDTTWIISGVGLT
jgi:phage-related tail fiber protein